MVIYQQRVSNEFGSAGIHPQQRLGSSADLVEEGGIVMEKIRREHR
jgi:hypothetical protein